MILAIDSSTSFIGLAISDGTAPLAETTWHSPLRHTVSLAPAVRNLLEITDTAPDQLKAIGVAIGPGSFTSLRVGLAFAKGMAAGLEIPVIGIPTLDILSAALPCSEKRLCAILQAGREKFAVQHYQNIRNKWRPDGDIAVHTAVSLAESLPENAVICGEYTKEQRATIRATNRSARFSPRSFCLRRAGFLAELAWKRFEKGDFPPSAGLAPIYLHTNDSIPA